MNLKRALVAAMLMAMGLLVAVDAGLIDWTTSALADHNDDPNDNNETPTDDEVDQDDEEAAVSQKKKRCNQRPDPKKCRRRKGKGGKQERRGNRDDNRGNRGNRDDTGDTDETDETDDTGQPSSSPPPTQEDECADYDGVTGIGTVDDVLCALLEDEDS